MSTSAAPRISIVLATYNRPDALVMVLRALADQTAGDFEVLVADDGSGPQTKAAIDALAPALPYPLRHIWQPDVGFRLAMVRNRAAVEASGDYLVFLDGDCMPLPDYIVRQRELATPGWFVTGNRILLSPSLSARILERQLPAWTWGPLTWIKARLSDDIRLLVPLLRLRNRRFREKPDWTGTEGCNIAAWRRDYLAVNGFDEAFMGWGYEDCDFAQRIIASGCRRKATRWAIPVLHLWHNENSRGQEEANRAHFERTLSAGRVRAERGVDQYLPGRPEPGSAGGGTGPRN
jgi:glycosyltransferase involved in cell wall biosynthesis